MSLRVLVVDDQESVRSFLARTLEALGYQTLTAAGVPEAEQLLEQTSIDLVILDLMMPEVDGIEGLRRFKQREPQLPVIILTAHATVETAVKAMKLGAYDYLRKPFETEELEITLERALEHRRLVEENRQLKEQAASRYRLENLVGRSTAMERLFELIRKVAPSDLPVLIAGESGTGKDLVARAVHGLSRRRDCTFLSVNCAAVPETLLESELFGHERGAFSGAERARRGYFREADGGTLFLDEIGDMSLAHQAKLLRVLETGELLPVGSDQVQRVDVRLVVATNRRLDELVRNGRFREDLLYRIDTVRLVLAPLRERREDIPLLVEHFLELAAKRVDAPAKRVSSGAMGLLLRHDWPGNVRELAHTIEHASLVAEGEEILPDHLPQRLLEALPRELGGSAGEDWESADSYKAARRAFERRYFRKLLQRAEGSVTQAAALAGIHRATLHTKLRQLGLSGDDGAAD